MVVTGYAEWCSGTWEHKARLQEMATTRSRPDTLMEAGEGRHHIGDFLPAEELNKFLTRYKVEYHQCLTRPHW